MKFNWNYPTTVWVGKNRINDLSKACYNLNITNPLFVTDKDLISLPFEPLNNYDWLGYAYQTFLLITYVLIVYFKEIRKEKILLLLLIRIL